MRAYHSFPLDPSLRDILSGVDVAPAAAEAKLEVSEFGISSWQRRKADKDAIGEMQVFVVR